jgi:hypothetical protein
VAILAGFAVYFSIPKSFVSGPQGGPKETLGEKLAKVDYLGAVSLVSTSNHPRNEL